MHGDGVPSDASDAAEDNDSFVIAGVGASAGGLAPTVELLRELGTEPGIGIAVVHHLDPTRESGLVEILSRATAMSVAAASDGVAVMPNHVYVIPPNAGLLINRGILEVVPRVEEAGLHLPIDQFFESLALDQGELAAGVVLSGSGFDGTEGIKFIKREGGIGLAQDATAQYTSMPQSAAATGYVDFVLPPAGLAHELRRMGGHARSLSPRLGRRNEKRDYLQVLAAVRSVGGVDFASYKQTTIRRRLQRRLFIRGLTEISEYVALLRRDPAEVRALCEELLVHVTGFFREPEAFEALRTHVFPRLCEDRPRNAPIRVWVPAGSTGEEVYSIAICLIEFLEETQKDLPVKIFGTDLSLAVIEKARVGKYPESLERDISEVRLRRFFSKREDGYQIRRDVRDLCVFAQHDVTRDPPFSAMDLISCRNLMIYLGPELQDRVIALLHFALREPGFLALGSAETVRDFVGFVTVDGRHKIYARTSAAPPLAFDFTRTRLSFDLASPGRGASLSLERAEAAAAASGTSDVQREADRLVLAAFSPPGVVVTNELAIVEFRGQTGAFLEHSPGAASLDLLRTAREELRLPLRRAIDQARSTQNPARETGLALVIGQARHTVTLEVFPFAMRSTRQRLFLILFVDTTPTEASSQPQLPPAPIDDALAAENALRQDLASTRHYLESVIEQLEATNEELKAANEEIVSSNEELRSTNEELQSAKEELQAANEELRTVNDELKDRNLEATRLSDDLTNVLTGIEIPILIVGRDLRLRRYTPAAGKVFGLVATDVGRPMSDIRSIVAIAPGLTTLIPRVLEQLGPAECTVQDAGGRWHYVSVRPYVTLDGRIDGTLISARDIDAERRGAERLAAAGRYAEGIVETVRDGLVVLDRDLRIGSANTAFQQAFGLVARDIQGRHLDELGRPALATPDLRRLLEGLRQGGSADDFRLEHDDGAAGTRVFLLNARRIEGADLVLLAIQDVTEAERTRVARAELGFRDALTGAAEGILMVDPAGKILFANLAATRVFGFDAEDLTGRPVDSLLPEGLREIHARHRADYMAAPSSRAMGGGRDIVGRKKDGSEFPIEVALSTMARERSVAVVAFVTDVTQRREAERQIRVYQDRLRRMAFDATLTEERERRRIAIELHDRIGQALALAQIKLTALRGDLVDGSRAAVDGAVDLLERAIADQRTLIFELSPPVLYDLGLKEALAWLAEDFEKRHGMPIEVIDDGAEKPLHDAAKAVVFRAVRELVMNVLKHAKSSSAKVSLRRVDGHLVVDVDDGGVGFDPHAPTDRPSGGGFGLLSVREQITGLGGTLTIDSAPQRGTHVSVSVPLGSGTADGPEGSDAPRGEHGTP
jgi:two-component system CheB/CheR fusion protein